MAVCTKCKATKPASDFYQYGKGKRWTQCKTCVCARVKENRAKKANYYRESDRKRDNQPHRVAARKAYIKTTAGRAARFRALLKQRAKSPEKDFARQLISNAIRDGLLKRMPCEKCGAEKTHAHHDDYGYPLNIRWLCDPCHKKHHREEKLK